MITSVARGVRIAERIVFGLLAAWLACAAALVDIEYYDGLDSVLNARFYTGQIDTYTQTRAPLMGLLLVPAEWVRMWVGADPLDVWPYHCATAAFNFGYFIGVYWLLSRIVGRGWPALASFVATVPSFIVFSYGPFISHDITPGLLILAMVVCAHRFVGDPSRGVWLALVGLGAAAPLIKYTYAYFWLAILIAAAVRFATERGSRPAARLGWLVAAGATSAVLVWVGICWAMSSDAADRAFLLRAVAPVEYLLSAAHQTAQVEPVWVYLRNAPAYGILAAFLVLPGLVSSWRVGGLRRMVAVVWIVLVVAYHVMPLRQVRELAFLGALTAVLIVPGTAWMLRAKARVVILGLLLAVDWLPVHPYANLAEAARIFMPFYRESDSRKLLGYARDEHGALRTPLMMNTTALSFVPDRETPLRGDVYHDVFHLDTRQIDKLFGLERGEIIAYEQSQESLILGWPETGALLIATAPAIVNDTGWESRPARNRAELRQFVLRPRSIELKRSAGGEWELAGKRIEARSLEHAGQSGISFSGDAFQAELGEYVLPRAVIPGRAEPVVVTPIEVGFFIPLQNSAPEAFTLRFFRAVASLGFDPEIPRWTELR